MDTNILVRAFLLKNTIENTAGGILKKSSNTHFDLDLFDIIQTLSLNASILPLTFQPRPLLPTVAFFPSI